MKSAFLLLLTLTACAPDVPPPTPTEEDLTLQDVAHVVAGGVLFTAEKFQGNGRVCATCHILDVQSRGAITPANVQASFAQNPTGPLFRNLDSDDGVGNSYTLLKRDATNRIPFTLPPNVTVDNPNGPNVHHNTDGTTTVTVRRSTPTVNNIKFENTLMWDGRLGADLANQSKEAVLTHYQTGRLPTTNEQHDIATFQDTLYSSIPLALFAAGAQAPTLPAGRNASEVRGRTFFVDSGPVTDATHRGLCATCHGGPMLNTTTVGNPVQPPGQRISNNLVSETNIPLGHGYPELTYHVALPHDVLAPTPAGLVVAIPAGTPLTITSSDPGQMLTTGDPCPPTLPLNCLLNPGTFLSLFKIPTLWGTANTAPYFHDNSAATFDAVMDRYVQLFAITAAGTGNPNFVISPQDRADIVAYLAYAFQ